MTASAPNLGEPVQEDFYLHLFKQFFLLPAAAGALIGCTSKHVHNLVKSGQIRGFNLAITAELPEDADIDEDTPRSMIRVQERSLRMFLYPAYFPRTLKMESLDLAEDLPHHREDLSVREVMRTIDCCDNHVRRLLQAGLVSPRKLSQSRSHIDRRSFLTFLKSREITKL